MSRLSIRWRTQRSVLALAKRNLRDPSRLWMQMAGGFFGSTPVLFPVSGLYSRDKKENLFSFLTRETLTSQWSVKHLYWLV